MWITGDVDVPQELLDALDDGSLVLFVGAGVSVPAPSNLPLFEGLARRVFSLANRPYAEDEPPDRALGRLKEHHAFDVHQRVKELIGDSSSRPNDLHASLVRLALTKGRPKIVTTNYDLHLSTVAADSLEVFHAPALPVGDDFEGIVHLHGSLAHAASHCVVTDRDFGRAYLTDGWATRFLDRMFRESVVVFVGYSHTDVVMNYLARGLPRTARPRFIFTNEPDARDWDLYGIHPIGYPSPNGDHSALGKVLREWAEVASYGLLDHRQRVQGLLSGPVQLVPEETDYLLNLFHGVATTRLFTEFADSAQWLDWIASAPVFLELVTSSTAETEVTRELAWWFCKTFVVDPQYSQHAYEIIESHGFVLNPTLRHFLGQQLHASDPPVEVLSRWVPLLVRDFDSGSAVFWPWILEKCPLPIGKAACLALFEACSKPRITSRSLDRIELSGEEHSLRHAWVSHLRPNLSTLADDLLPVVESHLRLAAWLVRSSSLGASDDFDVLSYGRSAIEPHEQDQHPDPLDILIDALRDVLDHYLQHDERIGSALIERWQRSDIALLRRLAVHGWVERRDIGPSEKVEWLLQRNWLFRQDVKHEVYRLVAAVVPALTEDRVDGICAEVLGVYRDAVEDYERYEAFNLLGWIDRWRPDVAAVIRSISEIVAEHPEWKPRDYPDLSHWFSAGTFRDDKDGVSAEEFHSSMQTDYSVALDAFFHSLDGMQLDGPSAWGRWSTIREVAEAYPEAGLRLLVEPDSHDAVVVSRLRQSALEGLSRASLTSDQGQKLLQVMNQCVTDPELSLGVAMNLESHAKSPGGMSEFALSSSAADLALALWAARSHEVDDETDWADSLTTAINHWSGKLAMFWLHRISHAWQQAGDEWNGIPPDARSAFESMRNGSLHSHEMAKVVLASQLHYVFAADESWTTARVLPLLNWSDGDATTYWSGYLTWGRWTNRLLNRGLLDLYVQTLGHLGSFNEDTRRRFNEHLAEIAVLSDTPPSQDSWIMALLANASDSDVGEWTRAVGWTLSKLDRIQSDGLWERWIGDHFRRRASGLPTQVGYVEGTALATWAVCLDRHFEEAVEILTSMPCRIDGHSKLLHDLQESHLLTDHAQSAAMLMVHLLRGTPANIGYLCYYIEPIVKALQLNVDAATNRQLIELALPLCPGAASW